MTSPLSPSAPDAPDGAATPRAWHGGWALGFAALAGLTLLLARTPPSPGVLWGLALVVVAGASGLVELAAGEAAALGIWVVATVAAVVVSGGVAGPLGPVLTGPLLASSMLGASRRTILLAALAAVAGALALSPQARGPVEAAPWLRGGVLAIVLAAAAVAVARGRRPSPAVEGRVAETVPPPDLSAALAEARAGRAEAEARAEGRARFLAQMSHELRTPLNAIQGFSDIMRTRLFGPIPERYGEYAELIHESGRHLTELIDDVLDLSKIEADRYDLRRETFDARDAINAALRLTRVQAEEAGVALRAFLPTASVMIDADRRALKQMVLNLLSNALKFTPRGGAVDVTLREAAGGLELAVSDTGVGIAPEELARLGRPYAQAQAGRDLTRDGGQGTGLGLSLVKAFAALHGGDLVLESRLGEGLCATLRLPVLAEGREAAQ